VACGSNRIVAGEWTRLRTGLRPLPSFKLLTPQGPASGLLATQGDFTSPVIAFAET
jgi:hypothetical protein